jgi:rare lipoprotein A
MMKNKVNLKFWFGVGLVAFTCGCAHEGREFQYENLTEEVSAIKKDGGYYKVGNPYKVMGQYYTPKEDYNYSEVGIASWYGDDFHDKKTANGETYDMRAITAAHRTLPLPSIVKVTNLENGRSIIARVNDRGPYVKNRIIDVSQKGAELLGYRQKGTAKVKVEILARESKAIKEAMLSKSNKAKDFNGPINYELAPISVSDVKKQEAVIVANNLEANDVKTVEKGNFFVQVGAFSDYNKAKEMAENMKRFGKVVIHEAYLSKDGVYRVRIGAYQSRNEALQILDRLLDYGHADVSIVQG